MIITLIWLKTQIFFVIVCHNFIVKYTTSFLNLLGKGFNLQVPKCILFFNQKYINEQMQNLIDFFRTRNHFEAIITTQLISNHKQISAYLLQEILRNPRQFLKYINHQYQQSLHQIQKITLVHLIILHSSEFYQLFQELQLNIQTQDSWINDNFLSPYQNFIRKLILSNEQYDKIRIINEGWNADLIPYNNYSYKQKMRENPKQYFNLELLCYCINMMNELFVFLRKIPTLGRYYPIKLTKNYESFVSIVCYQTSLLYFSFKFIMSEILVHHQQYLRSRQQQIFFKAIVSQNLQKINEQLKIVFLNKYYNPIQKGIKIGLFEIDKQTNQNRQALYQLQILTRQNMPKVNKNRNFLGKKIFGGKKFDSDVFQSSILLIDSELYSQNDLEQIYNKQNNMSIRNLSQKNQKAKQILSLQIN